MLRKQEVDLAITELEGQPGAGIRCFQLLKLPLQLLVSPNRRIRSASELWKKGEIDDPWICMPASETITKLFRDGLRKIGVDWPTSVEVSSLDLIPSYVRAGFGMGLSVVAPGEKPPAKVRLLPLPSFPPLIIAAIWQGKIPPIAGAFLESIKLHARALQHGA